MARDKIIKTLLLIDGNNLFHRAYHALPPLSDKTGANANAVFGFTNMLLKAIDEVSPSHIACAFDTAAPTFRHVEFEKYKAQRPAPPEDLYPQLPKVKGALDAFGISYFEKEGYEADDILATLAEKFHKKYQVIILSGDRDVLQLVNGQIKVQMPGWNPPAGKAGLKVISLFGAREVREKYGITPAQMVDYKSLLGDVSDNVPGVSGIGPKTASNLLGEHGTLENIYKNLNKTPHKVQQKLEEGKELALNAKKLVELDRKVDIGKLPDLSYNPDWERIRVAYEKFGFKSIIAKIVKRGGLEAPTANISSTVEEEKNDQLSLV